MQPGRITVSAEYSGRCSTGDQAPFRQSLRRLLKTQSRRGSLVRGLRGVRVRFPSRLYAVEVAQSEGHQGCRMGVEFLGHAPSAAPIARDTRVIATA
jgi:hypothetical protein